MANHIKVAMSLTPVAEDTIAEGGGGTHRAIGVDIGKTLGSSYTVDVAHTTVGYDAGAVAYANAPANGGAKVALGADATDYKIVFIKHTGFKWGGNATTLGDSTTHNLIVYIETEAGMAKSAKFTIPPGGSVILPNIDLGTAMGLWAESSSTDAIAVEYALVL